MSSYSISHYRILEKLGAGGMGEVYKAYDTTLDRPVALKILPPDLVEDEDRLRRFVQEAKSASALNHPHIITIYEIGEAKSEIVEARARKMVEGETGALVSIARETPIHYIAMEYIEGETLHAKIHRDQTSLGKLLEYLVQATDGLAKAHAAGLVHRDLKPDNIMINKDGYAKILDFGLAKLSEPLADSTKATESGLEEAATALMRRSQPGVVMGTVGYMSPEQAQGKAVDQRSDIFSFGCILYECATGHKPFEGDSLVDSLHKIIYTPPPPIKDFNPNCPYDLRRIIGRCLAKDPDDRYQRVKDISADLREFLQECEAEISAANTGSGISGVSSSSGGSLLDAPVVEPRLDESDPRVLSLARFSKSSVALAILGLLGAIVLWPMHQKGRIGSELKLDYTRDAALSKAREIVSSLGYETTNLENSIRFRGTNLDLEQIATREGLGEVRRAVREGKAANWRLGFARSSDEASAILNDSLKPGQFLVSINPQGQLVSFSTPPREAAPTNQVDNKQAVVIAEETARRWFSLDPTGYETEVVARSKPPGVVEITWRNPNPIFGHKEVVQANLQGAKITKLSRSLEPPELAGQTSSLSYAITTARGVIIALASVAMYAFGLVFLIRGKRWYALGRSLPITATVLVAALIFAGFYFVRDPNVPVRLQILIGVVFMVLISVAFLPSAAGLFEWLRVSSPERLFGAEQLLKRRIFSVSAASSLIHGVLGGALLAGISSLIGFLMTRIPGDVPSMYDEIALVDGGWPFAFTLLTSLPTAMISALCIAILAELAERFFRRAIFAWLVPTLLISVALTSYSQPGFRLIALSFLFFFLLSLVAVQLYRSCGLAAVWLALTTNGLLEYAAVSRYLQDPNFVLQSNLLVLVIALLSLLGILGYVRTRLRNVKALAVK